jgi:hypothetical protein
MMDVETTTTEQKDPTPEEARAELLKLITETPEIFLNELNNHIINCIGDALEHVNKRMNNVRNHIHSATGEIFVKQNEGLNIPTPLYDNPYPRIRRTGERSRVDQIRHLTHVALGHGQPEAIFAETQGTQEEIQ